MTVDRFDARRASGRRGRDESISRILTRSDVDLPASAMSSGAAGHLVLTSKIRSSTDRSAWSASVASITGTPTRSARATR